MSTDHKDWAEIDENGKLILPAEYVQFLGLRPGAQVRLEKGKNILRLHRPVTDLAKVYIEPTDMCNLDCAMCIRSGWEEPLGRMSQTTFDHILTSLGQMDPLPTVFFGGLGEPLFHPKTIEWVAAVKALGARVELITNGTTLTEKRSRQLVESGLDVLWVSIDGASSQSYSDLRLGAELPTVIENLSRLRKMRPGGHIPRPTIGIAFVAMKRNIHELQAVLKIGRRVGAKLFSVSNVMPYTKEMQAERLYTKVLRNITYLSSPWLPTINLTKMDVDETTREAFYGALNSGCNVTYAGNNFSGANDVCNFIESGSMSIAWDGGISPCWPLMHTHTSYLHEKEHRTRRHAIGFVYERSLLDLWLDPEYVLYRQKVQSFGFAPCTYCGGCDLSEANEEDCIGNEFPACGSCLWSQGLIQCP